jgi:hypothetical protein
VQSPQVRQPIVVPPRVRPFSILPAAAVLVLAVLTLASFAVVDLWVSPSTTPTTLPAVVVGALRLDPTTPVFAGWVSDGNPPADISTGLIAPEGTVYVATVSTGGDPADFDNEVRLSVPAPESQLLGFYKANLAARGWQLFSKGAAPTGGDELIFEKGGNNGDYWDLGVIAQTTRARRTAYTLRLFDVGDDE